VASVRVTFAHIQSWGGKDFESTRLVLLMKNNLSLVLRDLKRDEILRLEPERHALLGADSYYYTLAGSGAEIEANSLRIHFPLLGNRTKELCYQLPLAPKIFQRTER
jgi:hypothetical protein